MEVDPDGGENYLHLGTSQLVSVPYSLHSGTADAIVVLTTAQRNAITDPPDGMMIFNTDIQKIQIWNGQHWIAQNMIYSCIPKPDAGADQVLYPGDTAILSGNIPDYGTGVWSVQNGTGGVLEDSTNRKSLFYGADCGIYTLKWEIRNACDTVSDEVISGYP